MALDRHPLNVDFRWEPSPRRSLRRLTAEQLGQYDERGYFVLEGAFDRQTLGAVVSIIDPLEAEIEAFLRTREDGKLFIARADAITFSPHLVVRSEVLKRFCAGALFRDLVHDLIGPDVRLYWEQAVYKKPRTADDFPWHQDNGYTYIEPQRYLTCWIALTDVTEENGCPWVAPGLHRFGTLRHWMTERGWCCLESAPDAVPVPARAGSIVVFSSLTPHRTGPNLTDAARKAYIVQFAPDGAHTVAVDRQSGDRREVRCDVPDRQYLVLASGREPE